MLVDTRNLRLSKALRGNQDPINPQQTADATQDQDPINPQQTADEVPLDEVPIDDVPVDEVPIESTPAPSTPALVNAEVPVQQSHGVIRAARGGVMPGRGRRVRKTSEIIAKIGLKKMVIPKDRSGCSQDEPVALD
ncbi:hypothetical protein L1887_28716 [Cichorium endivia]|nr:hypothetical protein L1887_28716 [Cichorium endivia]